MKCLRRTQPVCITQSNISVYFQFLNIEMVVLKVLREFAGGTSIHGFTFLVSPKSSSRTKIIWAISIVVALSYASWEMKNSVIGKYILKTLVERELPSLQIIKVLSHKKLDRHQNQRIINSCFINCAFHKHSNYIFMNQNKI